MSLARLAKCLRKSHDKSLDGINTPLSPSRGGSFASPPRFGKHLSAPDEDHSDASMATTLPKPSAGEADWNPTPQPAPYSTADTVEDATAMSGALADLASMNTHLDFGPHVAKTERRLDAIGFRFSTYPSHYLTHIFSHQGTR